MEPPDRRRKFMNTFLAHVPVDGGEWDDVLEAFQLSNDEGTMCFALSVQDIGVNCLALPHGHA